MKHVMYARNFEGLMELVKYLRGSEGCTWDQKQTRDSMRLNVREECHELIDAINENDVIKLIEEMGDVLFHIVFQIRFGVEKGEFSEEDVFDGIIDKLIRRHPQVFTDSEVSNSEELLNQWHDIKKQERPQEASQLDGVPISLPALAYAQTLQERAARSGFDWKHWDGVVQKVSEEVNEIKSANTEDQRKTEVGDLLFSLVNACRWMNIDAESAISGSSSRFLRRFKAMELLFAQRGLDFDSSTLDCKEKIWQEVKSNLSDEIPSVNRSVP